MKSKNLFRLILSGLTIALFTECGSMRSVSIKSMHPAEITFPPDVNTLLLVDRTKFESGVLNIIEGVITGESPWADKAAAQELISSLQQTLLSSPRFKVIRSPEILKGNSISEAFPDALPMTVIEGLCTQYKTEAVVALEIFDSNFFITHGQRKKTETIKENGVKKEIEVDEFLAKGWAKVKMGFRLYDPKEKNIIDQQLYTKEKTWEGTGTSANDAVAHLINANSATTEVSRMAGEDYAWKIAPMPVRLKRQYYGKGKEVEQVAAGARKAEVNDWQGALDTWQSALNGAPPKDAARLSYNIAVAYEILGDMENAKKWAERSYVDYGNKKGKAYSALLQSRVRDEEISDQQMK